MLARTSVTRRPARHTCLHVVTMAIFKFANGHDPECLVRL
jgi:hypothetical protein